MELCYAALLLSEPHLHIAPVIFIFAALFGCYAATIFLMRKRKIGLWVVIAAAIVFRHGRPPRQCARKPLSRRRRLALPVGRTRHRAIGESVSRRTESDRCQRNLARDSIARQSSRSADDLSARGAGVLFCGARTRTRQCGCPEAPADRMRRRVHHDPRRMSTPSRPFCQ